MFRHHGLLIRTILAAILVAVSVPLHAQITRSDSATILLKRLSASKRKGGIPPAVSCWHTSRGTSKVRQPHWKRRQLSPTAEIDNRSEVAGHHSSHFIPCTVPG